MAQAGVQIACFHPFDFRERMLVPWVMHSDNDRSVPIDNALLMVEALKKAGARHKFHHYPDLGHMGISKEVIDRSLEFIKELPDISERKGTP